MDSMFFFDFDAFAAILRKVCGTGKRPREASRRVTRVSEIIERQIEVSNDSPSQVQSSKSRHVDHVPFLCPSEPSSNANQSRDFRLS
jgi:hypothetical protein